MFQGGDVPSACSKDEIGEAPIGHCAAEHDAADAKRDDGQRVFSTMPQVFWQRPLELEDELFQIALEGLACPLRCAPDLGTQGR